MIGTWNSDFQLSRLLAFGTLDIGIWLFISSPFACLPIGRGELEGAKEEGLPESVAALLK